MTKQTLLWTVVPFGYMPPGQDGEGQLRVSALVAPRLTPEAPDEQVLKAFPEFLDWPARLADAKFGLRIAGTELDLRPLTTGDSALWQKLFFDDTPVAGFQYQDMSAVNLRSFPVRSMLGYLRKHYSRLAVQAASNHPSLLPWKDAHPDLKDMLIEAGTLTFKYPLADRSLEVAAPGFSRFYDDPEHRVDEVLGGRVFGSQSVYDTELPAIGTEDGQLPGAGGTFKRRTLPADWYNPRPSGPGGPLVATKDATVMDQFRSEAEYALYQADRFYRRTPVSDEQKAMRFPSYKNVPPPPEIPEYDFHRIVASFGNYPKLLRELGLVIDFAVEGAEGVGALDPGAGTAFGNMALAVHWGDGHDDSADGYPRTAWQRDRDRFVTRPRRNDFVRGLLRLEHTDDSYGINQDKLGPFDIYQVDPDGASLKTVGFTLSAQNLVAKHLDFRFRDGQVTYTTGDRQAVAALRSGGLGVSQHGRAEHVADDAATATAKNKAVEAGNAKDIVFFAEDLFRGLRIDVAAVPNPVDPDKWRSLNARIGTYYLIKQDKDFDLGPDEGHVSGPSTTSSGDPAVNPDDHYLHESLFRWTGWSLSAPRPGKAIQAQKVEGAELQGEAPADITDMAKKGNNLAVTYKVVKGTLPKLRFGQLYRLRARYTDVAGNSLALDDPTIEELEQASDAVGYWRFEPVDPPTLVGRERVSEGESLERMVIRSNYDATPDEYLTSPDFAAAIELPASGDFAYTALNERHIVPPKSSQQQCETHGLFDPYFGQWGDIKKGYEIAAREDGTLFQDMPGSDVHLITPTALSGIAKTNTIPPALPDAENPVGDRMAGGQYVIHREAQITTPYLPDGASAGVAIRAMPDEVLPGITGEGEIGPCCIVAKAPNGELVLMIEHAKNWPDLTGFRIILAERKAALTEMPCAEVFADDGAPKWDENARTLTFFLPKGRIARLRYSSFVNKAFIESFGIVQWTAKGADQLFVLHMALLGSHWMMTPFRNLVMVHATQQPICLPEMINVSTWRPAGAQYADLLVRRIRLHGPSTGKIEVQAEWHEWIDDINQPKPTREHRRGQLGEVQLAENHANEVNLSAEVALQNVDPTRPRAPADRHELGDTKFRLIKYNLVATTRFREYLPPSLYAQTKRVTRVGPVTDGPAMTEAPETDPGAPVLPNPAGETLHTLVRASAAPDEPRVLYTVPTFRWNRVDTQAGADITRLGNGLRVWLDRPWFSSGDGELLGVILHGEAGRFTDIPDKKQLLVTQWGLDPVWETALPKNATRATDFPARVTTDTVRLQEFPASTDPFVEVVGHRVHWDDGRGLWYCDIELEPGASYMPFIRLALVRYQPNALPGHEISKVVTAEFAQVLPRRRAVFSVAAGKVKLRVHGSVPMGGPMKFNVDSPYLNLSFAHDPMDTGRNRFELVLQTRDPAIDSDLAWRDLRVLDSGVLGGDSGGAVVLPGISHAGIFSEAVVPAADTRSVATRAGTTVSLGNVIAHEVATLGPLTSFLDPAIWDITADIGATGGKPARLMLREFERYYTDRYAAEKRGTLTVQKRFVEERLVYAAILDLP